MHRDRAVSPKKSCAVFAALLVGLALAGCGPSAHLQARMGTRYPSNATCAVRFDTQDPTKIRDTSQFELIGILFVESADDDWTERMKGAVQPEVCRIGGDVAAYTVTSVNTMSGAQGASIYVFKDLGNK